jgi:hypothetical protein
MEYYLDIDQLPILRFEDDPRAPKLCNEHGKVEAPKVEAGEIARIEKIEEASCPCEKGWLIGDICVRDTMNRGRITRDRHLRVEATHSLQDIAMGSKPNERKFDDSVGTDPKPGRLKVEKNERTFEWKGESRHGGMGSGRVNW